jgi:phosphatidylserine decarboxylase
MSSLRARAFVWLQYLLPQHGLSRLVLRATRVRNRVVKNVLVRGFLSLYHVDMAEALEPDPYRYGSFNEFFTRALRSGVRSIAANPRDIACPVDGAVSECGAIEQDRLLQAKGRTFTLSALLAGCDWAREFENGAFATIYLAPFNYHRIHMPLDGALCETWFVPGRLFSVNRATAAHVPSLFARNERVVCLFDSAAGRFALVMVGALNVGSMCTVWAGDITPRAHRSVAQLPSAAVALKKGQELGRFNMGSTVILLFQPGRVQLSAELRAQRAVRLGERIGGLA